MTAGRLAVFILTFAVAAGGFLLGSQDRPGSQVEPITLIEHEPDAVRRDDEGSDVKSVPDDDDPGDDPPTRDRRAATASRDNAADGDPPARRQAATDDGARVDREPANSAPAGPVAADDTNDLASDDDGSESASDNT